MELSPEDAKLVTLAKATRARVHAREGAAVRDTMGRTYAAASLDLANLQVSALGACVAMAHSSGAAGLEAAVLLTEAAEVTLADRAALSEFAGAPLVVLRGTPAGVIVEQTGAEAGGSS